MSTESTELELFIVNDGRLYEQQALPILKNLALKKAKGIYQRDGAVKLYGYLADAGAKKYAREISGGESEWNRIFSVADRKAVATTLADFFETEWKLGHYRDLLPAKYKNAGKR